MLIRYDTDKEWQQPLINDIAPPHARPFVDVRSDTVRRHAIGSLQQQYLYSRSKPIGLTHHVSEESVHVRRLLPFAASITRIPPLLSLPQWQQRRISRGINLRKAGLWISTGWAWCQDIAGVFTNRVRQTRVTGFPYKRYTLAEGVVRVWPWRQHKHMQTIVPMLAAVMVLAGALWMAPQTSDRPIPANPATPQIVITQGAPAVGEPSASPAPASQPQSPATQSSRYFTASSSPTPAISSGGASQTTPTPVADQPVVPGGMGGGEQTPIIANPELEQPTLPLPEIPTLPILENLAPRSDAEDVIVRLLDS